MSQAENITECSKYFDSLDSQFFDPVTSSVFKPGATATVRWYAGVVTKERQSINTTFSLILQAYRNTSFVYTVLNHTTVPFSGSVTDTPVFWTYIPNAPCPATELAYFWPIPADFVPASETDFDYVLVAENITAAGYSITVSDTFQIVAPLPSPSSSSSSSSTSAAAPPTGSSSAGSASASQTSAPDTNSPSSSSSSSPPRLSNPSRGLQPGAVAGVAVGSIIGGVAVLLAAWLFYKRRSKANKATSPGTHESATTGDSPDGGAIPGGGGGGKKVEIDGRQIPRESGGTALHELEAAHRAEGGTGYGG
ncbi:hypothetical protein F5Y19DRAFT_441446 [Xylariaceae sp. FL1651]|nr:hypothetical protein F5Y19DRAFT_441446 [Xylariaceae sp. FL1651]